MDQNLKKEETQLSIDTKSLLGASASSVSNHLKEIYQCYPLNQPHRQYVIQNFHHILATRWKGVKRLDEFPEILRTPIQRAHASILDLAVNFEKPPPQHQGATRNNALEGANELSQSLEFSQWLKQIRKNIQIIDESYRSFTEQMKILEKENYAFKMLHKISPSATCLWLKHYNNKKHASANEFADLLVQILEKCMDQQLYFMEEDDKQIIKEFFLLFVSKNNENKIVDLESFKNFIIERSNERIKKEGSPLPRVLEYACEKRFEAPSPPSPELIPYQPPPIT